LSIAGAFGTSGDETDCLFHDSPHSQPVYQASTRAFAGAGSRASALPNSFAVMVRLTEAGIQAFMIRLSRPGMILERFTRNAFRPSDTHCSTLRGFIGMVRGSNPSLASTAVLVSRPPDRDPWRLYPCRADQV
jgi:hypothetical protein